MATMRNPLSAVYPALILAVLAASCGPQIIVAPRRQPTVVAAKERGPRTVKVPPGHYPPPGHCRLWYANRPPGQQPQPVRCDRLKRAARRGAFILYSGKAWDADYDWRIRERQKKGSVPSVILELTIVADR